MIQVESFLGYCKAQALRLDSCVRPADVDAGVWALQYPQIYSHTAFGFTFLQDSKGREPPPLGFW